jgi:hypothetical protein
MENFQPALDIEAQVDRLIDNLKEEILCTFVLDAEFV